MRRGERSGAVDVAEFRASPRMILALAPVDPLGSADATTARPMALYEPGMARRAGYWGP